jgi:hypothetical protein
MSKYILKTKKGEVIKTTQQESLELAIEFFSLTKNLSPDKLLSIYNVEKDEDRDRY